MPDPKRSIVIYDTEITAWEGSLARDWSESWEHPEPIQIGAVRLNTSQAFREEDRMQFCIRPKANPQLSGYIMELTGISQAEVDAGKSFPEAMKLLYEFANDGQSPLWSWGDDSRWLRRAAELHPEGMPHFPGGFFDICEVFTTAGIEVKNYSSGTVHKAFGLTMDGRAHQALFDAQSMAHSLQHLCQSNDASFWMRLASNSA